jgi:hypothetical protein
MEADWEFEIAPDAPVIDAAWPGLIDLRRAPHRISDIPEAAHSPAIAAALLRLNSPESPVWTSKCDLWQPESLDPDEFDSPPGESTAALACYIDLLPANQHLWSTLDLIAAFCLDLCTHLRAQPVRQCRLDLVARTAFVAPGESTLGITAYLAACAATPPAASQNLSATLAAFSDSVLALGSRL